MSEARTAILAAARVTTSTTEPRGLPPYHRAGRLDASERTALFCRRVGDYRTAVQLVPASAIRDAVHSVCSDRGLTRLGVPPALPSEWLPDGVTAVRDDGLIPSELDQLDGALTGCSAAIAQTGTIVLATRATDGRRALTLVPDLHICVVRSTQIYELVPEALAALQNARLERDPLTFVSGPSATSDIELSRVEGVHGPRTLIVIVSEEPEPTTVGH